MTFLLPAPRTASLALALLVLSVARVTAQPAPPKQALNELDAFMEKVLARREVNRQTLKEYILDEDEEFEILGPGRARLHRSSRQFTWYVRDGMHVRSPVRFNGVTVGEEARQEYEATWIRRERERQERRARREQEKAAGKSDTKESREVTISPDSVDIGVTGVPTEPRFVSEAYFMEFKFEPGNYYLAGREQLEGQDVLRIEYYPERMFGDDDPRDDDKPREGDKPADEERQRQQRDREKEFERDIERKMNKTALITLWVDPSIHQIVKYTFENVWLDFLPAAWLVRVDDIRASMTMGQPFPGVWLPREMNIHAGITLALGSFEASYGRAFSEYREAEVKTRITVPKRQNDGDGEVQKVQRVQTVQTVQKVQTVPTVLVPVPSVPVPVPAVLVPVPAVLVPVPAVPVPEVPVPEMLVPMPEVLVPVPEMLVPVPEMLVPMPEVPVPKMPVPVTEMLMPVPEVVVPVPEVPVPEPRVRERSARGGPFVDDAPLQETVGEIRVHGNASVSDAEVIAIAGVAAGKVLPADGIEGIERRLKASGRFETVDVRKRYRSLDMTDVALVLLVHERPGVQSITLPDGTPRIVRLNPFRRFANSLMFLPIVNYADGYGFTYGARFSSVGLLGMRERLSVPLTWGGTRRAAFEFERTFKQGPFTRILSSVAIWQRENPRFDIDDRRFELQARAERALGDFVRLGADTSRSTVRFGALDDDMWTAGADVQLDTRGDPAYPGNAVLLKAAWTGLHITPGLTGRALPRINRYTTDARGYLRVVRQVVLAGRALYTAADATLPPYERLLLGGSSTLRGFRTGTFDGDRLLVTSVEVRAPITSVISGAKLGFNAFLDAGQAWNFDGRRQDAEWHRGAGAGVFLLASVVRLNLSVARGLKDGGTRVHLSSGFSF